MELELEIKSYCRITNHSVSLNGKEIPVTRSNEEESIWLDDIYRSLKMQYLKFFKMDGLCKAGFLAAELVCNDCGLDRDNPKRDTAIVCVNSSSSLDDDTVYQQTIEDKDNYYPSPSVFVYTLANIVTGEIAIRHKIMGETSFYITENFSPQYICDTINDVFADNSVNGLLCGWTEYYHGNCDVLMMYICRSDESPVKLISQHIAGLYGI